MSSRPLPALLVTGFLALSLAACGRAGPLEAPPRPGDTKQVEAQKTVEDEEPGNMTMSPIPTPQKQPKRPITVPKEPFFLDPIL